MLNASKGKPLAPVLDEREHFYVCNHCGQAVDMRLLGDVLYHDEPGHEPLARQ
jgi:hypothetical protein